MKDFSKIFLIESQILKIIYALTHCGTSGITVIIIKQLLLTLIFNPLEILSLPQPNISGIFKEVKNLFSQTNQFFCWLPLLLLHWILWCLIQPGGLSLAHQVLLFPLRTPRSLSCAVETVGYTILRKVVFSPLWSHILWEGHSRNAACVPECFRDCNTIIPSASFWFCSCF